MKNTPHKAVINISTYFHKVEPTGEVSTPLSFSHNKEAGVKNFNIVIGPKNFDQCVEEVKLLLERIKELQK